MQVQRANVRGVGYTHLLVLDVCASWCDMQQAERLNKMLLMHPADSIITKAIIMMVVRTGMMKINFFKKDPQAVSGGTGTA